MDINGTQLISRFLEARMDLLGAPAGIVAGIAGTALQPLHRALARSRLTPVLACHEQGAGFIAQGIARVSGHAGICLAGAGPGLSNTVTALADARADSVPMVCFAGQVPRAWIGSEAVPQLRSGHIVDSITKAHFELRAADDLPELLPEAFRIAESGRPGPVLLELPEDVQTGRLSLPHLPRPCPPERAPPEAAAIVHAAAMIEGAQRPVLCLGDGVIRAQAQRLAQAFAERAGLPTITTLMALGTLLPAHPLHLGVPGMRGAHTIRRALGECDLLITIGCRFDGHASRGAGCLAPQAQRIHIDADRLAPSALHAPHLAIEADAALALSALRDALRPQRRSDWLARIGSLRRDWPPADAGGDARCRPQDLIGRVAALAARDTAISADIGAPQRWVAQHYPLRHGDRWLTSGGLGSRGFGLPAAIGAALANPRAGALCFSDVSSLLINVQELETLAELRAELKIVVIDSEATGSLRRDGPLHRHPPSCCAIAEAFGVPAVDLGMVRDPAQALREAFAQPGPMLIHAAVAADEALPPMLRAGGANTATLR